VFNTFEDVMMETVCIVAFFAFLRCGEFTCKTEFESASNLCIGDVNFHDDHVILKLKQSKSDPFRKGVSIKLFCTGHHICPCCNLKKYIDIRKKQFNIISLHDPLYVNFHGQALTRNMFLAFLKQLLQVSGLPCDKYSGHSFRIGAATSAAAARIEDHLIKTLGRWSSDSYCHFILTPNYVTGCTNVFNHFHQ